MADEWYRKHIDERCLENSRQHTYIEIMNIKRLPLPDDIIQHMILQVKLTCIETSQKRNRQKLHAQIHTESYYKRGLYASASRVIYQDIYIPQKEDK